jgi:hypothetical protein
MSLNALATLALLRHQHGGPRLAPLAGTGLRAGLAALLAGLGAALGQGFAGTPLGQLLAGAAAFAILAIPGTWILGDKAMREALLRLVGRLRRRRS